MFHWIASHWGEWTSKPEWWQAWAAFAGVVFAALLYCVTRSYVTLTKRLLQTQIDPVVDFTLLFAEGTDTSLAHAVRIANIGSVPVVLLRMTSRAYRRMASGAAFPIIETNASPLVIKWPGHIGPGDDRVFQFKETVRVASDARHSDTKVAEELRGTPAQASHGQGFPPSYEIVVEASYQRQVDLKQFRKTLRLVVDWLDNGTPFLTDAAIFST